jgi:hypothetical protein
MQRLILFLSAWLLPLFALADVAPDVSLRLIEGEYLPGDVLELEAEMRGAVYAEFELHVPANAQCHFVAQTREPVRYIEGEYLQRVLLLLQPMRAGDFALNRITATIVQGGTATDVALPSVLFSVASYAAEDTSQAVAELGTGAPLLAQASDNLRIIIAVLFVVLIVIWLRLKVANSKPVETVEVELGLSDLIVALEGNAPSLPLCEADEQKGQSEADERKRRSVSLHGSSGLTPMMIVEQLLARSDLSLSPNLREHLEAAAYANRIDTETLLGVLRQEVAR